MSVPHGSLWRVLPFVAPSVAKALASGGLGQAKDYVFPVNAWDIPASLSKAYNDIHPSRVEFPVGTLLVVGDTVPDAAGNPHCSFVEVLLPQRAYINRTHFNGGSPYLERVA